MTEKEKLELAQKIVNDRLAFFQHFIVYVICVVMFIIINYKITPYQKWWFWPTMGWGIGIICHFISINKIYTTKFQKKMIQREIDKMD